MALAVLLALSWCALCALPADGARVLAVFGMKGMSHTMVNEPIVRALAARGHTVDVFGHYVPVGGEAVANLKYTKLQRSGALAPGLDVKSFESAPWMSWVLRCYNPIRLLHMGQADCEAVFADPAIKELIKSDNKYDLFITELFNADCYLGFSHRFQAPVVALSTCPLLPWANGRFGNPYNPAYVPGMHSGLSDDMALWERVVNSAIVFTANLAQRLYFEQRDQALLDRVFGPGVPPVRELALNSSLLFSNTFHALSLPRPLATNVVEIGGIHITKPDPDPLPEVKKVACLEAR